MKRSVVLLILVLLILSFNVYAEGECINRENAGSWSVFTFDKENEIDIFPKLQTLHASGKMNADDNSERGACRDDQQDNNCFLSADISSLEQLSSSFSLVPQPYADSYFTPSDTDNSNFNEGSSTSLLVTWIYSLEETVNLDVEFRYDDDLALYVGTGCGEIEDFNLNCRLNLYDWADGPETTRLLKSLEPGWNVLILIVDNDELESNYLRYTNPNQMLSRNPNILMYSDPSQAQPDQPCTTTEVKNKEGQTRATYTKICNRNQCAFEEECVNPGIKEDRCKESVLFWTISCILS